jgi:transcriptional antiterminator RfaH
VLPVAEPHHEDLQPMPILSAEPAIFPEGLLGSPPLPTRNNARWYVLHTRPRQEKSLARELYNKECPFFLPLLPRRLRVRGKILTSHVPLFSGYVFLLHSADERSQALATRRVVRTIAVADQEQLWHDLRQVTQLLASGSAVEHERQLAPGALVEIRDGPLSGLRGKVLRSSSGRRFVVQVNFIQQGASVLIDDVSLVRVDESPPRTVAGVA